MKVHVFASGSSGNCLLVSDGDTNILIDAGISMRRIKISLARLDLTLRDIGGVFITHEHSDHISGLQNLLKYSEISIFAPHTVANRMRGMLPEIDERLRIIPVGEPIALGSIKVIAFHTPHDTPESVGYRVEGEGVFGVATDMGHVTEEIRQALYGADTVLIESNHDESMLSYGPYPIYLKRRILSENGHLSNEGCASLARELAEHGTSRIILGHLSRENNEPQLALAACRAMLGNLQAELMCAPVFDCLSVDVGEESNACCEANMRRQDEGEILCRSV